MQTKTLGIEESEKIGDFLVEWSSDIVPSQGTRKPLVEKYRKSSIRSRPCIISNPKFPRLVLEVFQKLQFLEQIFLSEAAHKGPNRVILKDLNFCQ